MTLESLTFQKFSFVDTLNVVNECLKSKNEMGGVILRCWGILRLYALLVIKICVPSHMQTATAARCCTPRVPAPPAPPPPRRGCTPAPPASCTARPSSATAASRLPAATSLSARTRCASSQWRRCVSSPAPQYSQ